MEGIVDELRELLGKWLHVIVFDDGRGGTEIRAKYEEFPVAESIPCVPHEQQSVASLSV